MNNDDLHQKGTNLRRQLLGEEGFKHASSVTYKHPAMKKFIDVGLKDGASTEDANKALKIAGQ